ncbi:hypothetical protein [Methylorubrum populi]|uniref:hypothetical protein n=1 Tax=Methylorubrum populi TaxID=223967 RepID=UPI001645AEC2|nr:hypothetical protein [Methylorubrum populi]
MSRFLPALEEKGVLRWLASDEGDLMLEDTKAWDRFRGEVREDEAIEQKFAWHFAAPPFRSLFDYRTRTSSSGASLSGAIPELARATDLYIKCKSLGPRCLIQHGHSTWIEAESVGSDFWVNQNVTIGWANGGRPRIGNNVVVRTGAVVVGNVEIGDGVRIFANAVVGTDVPKNSNVYPARSVIVPRR